jgi:hypothetical protein
MFWLALISTMFPSPLPTNNYIFHQEQESAFDGSFFVKFCGPGGHLRIYRKRPAVFFALDTRWKPPITARIPSECI